MNSNFCDTEHVQRRISSSGRTLPNDCIDKIKAYLDEIQTKVKKYKYDAIFNFDESSLEKVRLSCLFTASADGYKLPILCVVPR